MATVLAMPRHLIYSPVMGLVVLGFVVMVCSIGFVVMVCNIGFVVVM